MVEAVERGRQHRRRSPRPRPTPATNTAIRPAMRGGGSVASVRRGPAAARDPRDDDRPDRPADRRYRRAAARRRRTACVSRANASMIHSDSPKPHPRDGGYRRLLSVSDISLIENRMFAVFANYARHGEPSRRTARYDDDPFPPFRDRRRSMPGPAAPLRSMRCGLTGLRTVQRMPELTAGRDRRRRCCCHCHRRRRHPPRRPCRCCRTDPRRSCACGPASASSCRRADRRDLLEAAATDRGDGALLVEADLQRDLRVRPCGLRKARLRLSRAR